MMNDFAYIPLVLPISCSARSLHHELLRTRARNIVFGRRSVNSQRSGFYGRNIHFYHTVAPSFNTSCDRQPRRLFEIRCHAPLPVKRDSGCPPYDADTEDSEEHNSLQLSEPKDENCGRSAVNHLFSTIPRWSIPSVLASFLSVKGITAQIVQTGSILTSLLVLGMIIVVHEAGHFWAARLQGMKVSSFSLGFGPVLWRRQGEETEYSLRAIPMGGFVAFPDPDENPEGPEDPRLLQNRPILDRAIVISAGVIANLIFAYFILLAQVFTVGIIEPVYQPGVAVPQVAVDMSSAASDAGIKAGDVILQVDGNDLPASQQSPMKFAKRVDENKGEPLHLKIKRGVETIEIDVVPELQNGSRRLGVVLSPNAIGERRRVTDVKEAVVASSKEFQRMASRTVQGLASFGGNLAKQSDNVAGPVGVVAVGANIAKSDGAALFSFAALISINIAFFNSLPIPGLDGGQLAFLLLEGARGGIKLPRRLEEGFNGVVIFALLILTVYLIIVDASRLGFLGQMASNH